MTSILIDESLAKRRARMASLLQELVGLAQAAHREQARLDALSLAQAAGEPFLFVALGEVKTGKSSFINALLGSEVSAVAPDPCTDRILMIAHGAAGNRRDDGELFSRVELDNPMLQDLAVVDTPGVDSVMDRHQEITESFLPRCDLALFVFSALNPYARSAWDFLGLVAGQWGRKVVLVLTQADLATPGQLQTNRKRVEELARERGLGEPPIFVVSSALEAVQPELSGMEAVRVYIREAISGGAARAKEASLGRGALKVLEDLAVTLAARRQALVQDQELSARINARLDAARDAARREAAGLSVSILGAYQEACWTYLAALEQELSFPSMIRRSVLGFFRRGPMVRAMLDALARNFRQSLDGAIERSAGEGASALSQHLALEVAEIARQLRDLAAREGRLDAREAAAAGLPGQREAVLRDVARALDGLAKGGGELAHVDAARVARMDPKAAMGGLMVLAGGLFALSVKGVVFDVTGGVLAGTGVALAGGVLAVSRPRLLRKLRENLRLGGERLQAELSRLFEERLQGVFTEILARLQPFEEDAARREAGLAGLEAQRGRLSREFALGLDRPGENT